MEIQKIPKSQENIPQILNVAAYARVSSGKDAMLHSLSAQTSYYSELIQSNPMWSYAGVYADEARTGTKDSRAEFQQLISDCRAGYIDMIITKTVSRFARNTVTLLSLCREFKAMGVDVYFEKENIHTLSEEGEVMLALLASVAQAESEQVSENMKWRVKEKFKKGEPTGFTIYGYEVRKGKFTIVEEEAAVVREIFNMYLDGMGSYLIADELNSRGIKSPYGGVWHDGTILKMLHNEKYAGDLELQKTFVTNPITKKQVLNKGQKDKYYVDDNHTPIIERETFDKVQKLIGEKEKRYAYSKPYDYRFKGMVYCGTCGDRYYRKKAATGTNYERYIWRCRVYNNKGKAYCDSRQITDKTLCTLADEFKKEISRIEILPGFKVRFIFTDGTDAVREWEIDRKWSDEMKQKNYDNLRRNTNANSKSNT